MKYFKKIIGERIYLSPINENDLELYTKWMNDSSVTDGLGMSSRITTLSNEADWITNTSKNGEYQFAIIDKKTDSLIGGGGFSVINHLRQIAEVGLFIGDEENRNNGYGTEALNLIIKYGFEYLNLNNVMLKVYSFNKRAVKCYEKVGFKEFGRRHQVIPMNNNWYDEIYMEILKSDYFKNR